MGKERILTEEDKAELAFSRSGVAEFLNAEQSYWETFFYGADVGYEEETRDDPNFKNISCFIDALFTSIYLVDMEEIAKDHRLIIGGKDNEQRFGTRQKFDPKKHSYSTHPKAQLPILGQTVECIGSQVSTRIKGKEYVLSEAKWDIARPNAVEEMAELNERYEETLFERSTK